MRRSPWNRGRAFRVVSVAQTRRETGLTFKELLELPEVELLTRVFADGRSEEALRVPVERVSEETDAN